MLGLAAGLAALLIFGLLVAGVRLARDPGVVSAGLVDYAGEPAKKRVSLVGRMLSFLDRVIGGRVLGQMPLESRRKVRAAIVRAGSPEGYTVESLIKRQATWAALGLVLALYLLLDGQPIFLILPVAGWFLPRLSLMQAARKRSQAIEKELPDFLDVLNVTISAGLGFRSAMRRVSTLVGGPVGEEMLITLRQIELGATSRAAFGEMRERTNAPSLHSFITAFLQSEELGTPIGGFLEMYAKELRRTAGQRARTAAARANPKISLIMTLILTPAIVLLLLGSMILNALVNR